MKCLTLLLVIAFSASAGLNVGTFNIRNFDKPGSPTDKNLLKDTIDSASPDLMAVQEIFNASAFNSFVKKQMDGYDVVLSRCGGAGGQKLGFVFKKSVVKLIKLKEDARLTNAFDQSCGSLRPALVGNFKDLRTGKTFTAISVHLKAGSGSRNFSRRDKQYGMIVDMFNELKASGETSVIAMGDFNTTGFDKRNDDYRNFQNLLKGAGANTSAEAVKCTSYWSGNDRRDGIEEASTLDHVVYTHGFMGSRSASARVGGHCERAACENVYADVLGETYRRVSDHCPVTITFN